MDPFDYLFNILPHAYLLLWKGHGEPPVAKDTISMIEYHFNATGLLDKVSFDVVTESDQTVVMRNTWKVFWRAFKWVRLSFNSFAFYCYLFELNKPGLSCVV